MYLNKKKIKVMIKYVDTLKQQEKFMNKNIQKYKQVATENLTGKALNVKVFSSLKSWLVDTYNINMTLVQRLNALNNSITLALAVIQNLSHEIPEEERNQIVMILNIIIKKCSETVSIISNIDEKHFKSEIDSINEIIDLINK